jgi:hypothetical protein
MNSRQVDMNQSKNHRTILFSSTSSSASYERCLTSGTIPFISISVSKNGEREVTD